MGNWPKPAWSAPKFLALLILVLLVGLYAQALSHPLFLDDVPLIQENGAFHQPWWKLFFQPILSLPDGSPLYYRPVQMLTYAFEYALWGARPFGYHAVNLLLHGLNTWMVASLLSLWAGVPGMVAGGLALLYSIHPMHVAAVAYVSGRSDLLSTLGLIGMLLFWRANRKRSAVFCFALALFSREVALVGIPIMALVLLEDNGWRLRRIPWVKVVPFVALAAVYLFIRTSLSPFAGQVDTPPVERRVFLLPYVFHTYLHFFFFPVTPQLTRVVPDPFPWWSWGAGFAELAGALICAVWLWRRFPWSRFWLGWIGVTLLPALNLFGASPHTMVDHWLILPGVGVVGLCAAGWGRIRIPPVLRTGMVVALCLWGMVGAFSTWRYARYWDSVPHLYGYLVQYNPQAMRLRVEYADALLGEGRFAQSLEEAVSVLGARPLPYRNREILEEQAWSTLGRASFQQGHLKQALWAAQGAVATHRGPVSCTTLAVVQYQMGNVQQAEDALKGAIGLDPNFSLAWVTLGHLYYERRDWSRAREAYQALVRLSPLSPLYRQWLADTYRNQGEISLAESEEKKARYLQLKLGR